MSVRWMLKISGIPAILGLLLSVGMAIPACYAGGAVTIIPDKNQLAPRGSYIPDRRVEQVLKKIEEHKAKMKEKQALEHEKQQQDNQLPKVQSSDKN